MAGGRHASDRSGTPRGELARIRETRVQQAEKVDRAIREAMLETCGEKGFRRVAVQDVIERYGGNRVQFYRHYASKADCYAAAYETGIGELGDRVLGQARAERGWRPGLRAGLEELARYAEQGPVAARGLLVEVHVAGGASLSLRAEVCERFAKAIDGGRREPGADRSPPPITAQFMVGAVESTLAGALIAGEPHAFSAAVPELAHMIVSAYLGEDEAGEELAAATAA